MFTSAYLALRQTFSPMLRGVLIRSVILAIVLLVGLGVVFEAIIASFLDTRIHPWVDATIAVIAGLGLLFAIFYLVPVVSTMVAGFFLDDVAARVEAATYPEDPPGRPHPVWKTLIHSLRTLGLALVLNIAALALLMVPGVNVVIFLVINAYLLSREYFELAAMRYSSVEEARALRRAHKVQVFIAGLLIVPILLVPILNLIVPIYGTAFMVHLYHHITRPAGKASEPRAITVGDDVEEAVIGLDPT